MQGRRQRWLLKPSAPEHAGAGHVARCLSLAVPLSEIADVALLLRGSSSWSVRAAELNVRVVDIIGDGWDGVVIDDYGFGPADADEVRSLGVKMLVQFVDGDSAVQGVDMIVNGRPGLSGDNLGNVPALLGSRYACLSPLLQNLPEARASSQLQRIFVSMGWLDAPNATCAVLKELATLSYESALSVDVVLGPDCPHLGETAVICSDHKDWVLHVSPLNPMEIAVRSDMAVAAGGQTMLELLASGVPTVAIETAENQRANLEGAEAAQAIWNLGRITPSSHIGVASAVRTLAADPAAREALRRAARAIIDRQGGQRVAEILVRRLSCGISA